MRIGIICDKVQDKFECWMLVYRLDLFDGQGSLAETIILLFQALRRQEKLLLCIHK